MRLHRYYRALGEYNDLVSGTMDAICIVKTPEILFALGISDMPR